MSMSHCASDTQHRIQRVHTQYGHRHTPPTTLHTHNHTPLSTEQRQETRDKRQRQRQVRTAPSTQQNASRHWKQTAHTYRHTGGTQKRRARDTAHRCAQRHHTSTVGGAVTAPLSPLFFGIAAAAKKTSLSNPGKTRNSGQKSLRVRTHARDKGAAPGFCVPCQTRPIKFPSRVRSPPSIIVTNLLRKHKHNTECN